MSEILLPPGTDRDPPNDQPLHGDQNVLMMQVVFDIKSGGMQMSGPDPFAHEILCDLMIKKAKTLVPDSIGEGPKPDKDGQCVLTIRFDRSIETDAAFSLELYVPPEMPLQNHFDREAVADWLLKRVQQSVNDTVATRMAGLQARTRQESVQMAPAGIADQFRTFLPRNGKRR